MPSKPTRKRAPSKGKAAKAAAPAPERFTEDGRRIVKLEKTRAHQRYILKNGTQVPGASTICKIGDDNSSLIHWAWQLGMDGIDYRKARDQAADIGTIAHFLIECFLHNHEADLSDFSPADIARARVAFANFKKWWDEEGLTVLEPEVQLVSEAHGYGGTIDAPSKDRHGNVVLLDWKTSKGIWPSHRFQLAAYERLWNENRPDLQVSRRAVVRIGKESENDFEVGWMASSEAEWRVFLKRLELYYEQNAYKKAA